MNYDLSKLSPVEFEALSRDLVGRATATRFEAFPEGRDEGIDGRFVSGPDRIIFQAKHLERSGYSALKSTMRRERTVIDRLAPSRYILATSVPLSPARKKALGALIGPAMLTTGDMFGADDLQALLREHSDLVREYPSLWLASGVVLKELLDASLAQAAELREVGLKAIQSDPPPIQDTIHGELERTSNPRFGFSFLHPRVWDRKDPTNGDGNTFTHPKERDIEILAWGGYAVVSPEFDDWVEQVIEWESEKPGFVLVTNVASGGEMIDFVEGAGGSYEKVRTQIEGRRIVFRTGEGGHLTQMRMFLQLADTQVSLACQAPTNIFEQYEDLFLKISKEIYVLGPSSAPFARRNDFLDQRPPLWRRLIRLFLKS